ncbi:hypothetical protein [Lentzea californiensis]|uniref:hypothetical protein n=1 Tax=Lentzea californiensis TaxID=438851 RepID=UPI002164B67E|nr:hypothetical protein [Lentzea californiensis]
MALPAERRVFAQVAGDHAGDRQAHLGLGVEVPLRLQRRLVGDAQVGAEHVDADLALRGPLVGQGGEGVDAGEADSRRLVADLVAGGAEAFVAQLRQFAGLGGLADALFPVGDDERHDAKTARPISTTRPMCLLIDQSRPESTGWTLVDANPPVALIMGRGPPA